MDKLLQLENALFYKDVVAIEKKVFDKIFTLEESSFNWMDGILEDARKVFNLSDNICLLPKTPSAKQKGRQKKKSNQTARRKIQVEENEDDYVPPQENEKPRSSKQSKKGVQQDVTVMSSDEDFDLEPASKVSKVEKSPTGRKTRATNRAATTSRARNTRNARNTRKNKSDQPVLNVEQCIRSETEELLKTPMQTEMKSPAEKESVTETWIQSAGKTIRPPSLTNTSHKSVTETPSTKNSLDRATTPSNKESLNGTIHEILETWVQSASKDIKAPGDKGTPKVTNSKTPIHNFNSMNVKEKVHAYEEIILISPMTTTKKRTDSTSPRSNNTSAKTPETVMSQRTPPNATVSHKTPDTVVNTKRSRSSHSLKAVDNDSDLNSPEENVNGSSKKKQKTRLSKRLSVCKSLKTLPSSTKIQTLHQEQPETKPTRARTRLRLKKKEQKQEDMESEQETVSSVSTDDHMETDNQDEENTSSPRKTRGVTRNDGNDKQTSRNSSQSEKQASSESEDNNEHEEPMQTPPKVVRSTRTKTRQAQNQHIATEVERMSSKDSGLGGSSSSVDGDGTPCVTRSKMRKPKEQMEVTGSDSVMASPAVTRVTRTKTRKRQHEEESEAEQSKPKRSCTSNSSRDAGHNKMSADEQSSEDEVTSPVCPANKVVRPVPSFLNSLNKNSHNPIRPANLNTGGLVKSFLVRNSPAPKPTLSEIQAKRKQELLEKEKKEKERLKKREEEQSRKMEEMRKKREEKMKKVQEMREQRQRQEKENRMQMEKRLMEKRQQTIKLREEKIKEEREKQKMRLQKMEEAEERRKQDEEERQKKLQEQREQERFHEEMLQRKKEFEEQERQQKIEEEKKRAAERQQEAEREREKEKLRLLKIEEEKKKEWQKKKEERERLAAQERAEKEKLELEKKREREIQMKKEMERIREQERMRLAEQERIKAQQRKEEEEIKKMVHKHNAQVQQSKLPKPNMNKTHSLEEATVQQNSSVNNDSYEMTPKRVPMASTSENYGIDDLNSGDETDDDECPRKKIPDWAQGSQLKALLIKQHYHPPNIDELFDVIEAPDLNNIFMKKKARFNKRTSSAHWDSPILKPGLLGRV